MKKWDYTIGVDVSKNTLDIHCAELNEHIQISNNQDCSEDQELADEFPWETKP